MCRALSSVLPEPGLISFDFSVSLKSPQINADKIHPEKTILIGATLNRMTVVTKASKFYNMKYFKKCSCPLNIKYVLGVQCLR